MKILVTGADGILGICEGEEETMKLVEKYSNNGGLKSTLDLETTQILF